MTQDKIPTFGRIACNIPKSPYCLFTVKKENLDIALKLGLLIFMCCKQLSQRGNTTVLLAHGHHHLGNLEDEQRWALHRVQLQL